MNVQNIINKTRKIGYRFAKEIVEGGCVFSKIVENVEILGGTYQIEVSVDCSRELKTYSMLVKGIDNNFGYHDSGNCL